MHPVWLLTLAALVTSLAAPTGFAQTERAESSGERALNLPDEQPPDASSVHGLLRDGPPLLRRRVDDSTLPPLPDPKEDFYHPWQWSATYLTGFIGVNLGPLKTPFSMLPELVRLNCVWDNPNPHRLFRGSWEGILELDTLPVVDGPASIVIGSSLLLRYNIATQKDHRFVPFIQTGFGGMYTDAYLHHSRALSSGFEYIYQAGFGANFFVNRRWALTAEWNFYHFSNGGIVLPNISVNMMGGLVGVTYFFGRR